MQDNDDAEKIRIEDEEWDDRLDQITLDPDNGALSVIGVTSTKMTYPTRAVAYYWMKSVDAFGPQTEGSPATFGGPSGGFYASNVGSAIPPNGTRILTTFIGNRWVFRYDG